MNKIQITAFLFICFLGSKVFGMNPFGEFCKLLMDNKDQLAIAMLKKNKALVHIVGKGGATALHLAAETGFTSVVERLIADGAYIEAKLENDGHTPLLLAIQNGHIETVKALIEAGADVNNSILQTISPLISAMSRHRLDIVEAILASGQQINDLDAFILFAQLKELDAIKKRLEEFKKTSIQTTIPSSQTRLALYKPIEDDYRKTLAVFAANKYCI